MQQFFPEQDRRNELLGWRFVVSIGATALPAGDRVVTALNRRAALELTESTTIDLANPAGTASHLARYMGTPPQSRH